MHERVLRGTWIWSKHPLSVPHPITPPQHDKNLEFLHQDTLSVSTSLVQPSVISHLKQENEDRLSCSRTHPPSLYFASENSLKNSALVTYIFLPKTYQCLLLSGWNSKFSIRLTLSAVFFPLPLVFFNDSSFLSGARTFLPTTGPLHLLFLDLSALSLLCPSLLAADAHFSWLTSIHPSLSAWRVISAGPLGILKFSLTAVSTIVII